MADHSQIEWTDATWNPLVGCDQISPGCAHCYAKEQHDRRHKAYIAGKAMPVQYAQPFEVVQVRPDRLDQPLHWRKPRRVFVNSLSDLFHDDVPDDFVKSVFTVMAIAKRHTFQVLTKRPERMRRLVSSWRADDMYDYWYSFDDGAREVEAWPLPNVWLGVSVENQRFVDERIPLLLQTPAAVRFISAEPLLGPIDLSFVGQARVEDPDLDWVIVGGESGPHARPFDLAWARSIVEQCKAAGVPVFMKQLGARPTGRCTAECSFDHDMTFRDKKGGDPAEWPADLRVREFPATAVTA